MNDAIKILLDTIEDIKNDILNYINDDVTNDEIINYIEKQFYEILGI